MPLNAAQVRARPSVPLIALSSDFIRTKEYLEAIVSSTSDAICTTDVRGRIIYFSPGAETMLACPAAEAAGRYAHQFYQGGRQEAERIMKTLRKNGSIKDREMVLKSRGGRRICVTMSASLLRDRNGKVIGTLGISKDITRHIEMERRLRELSITDNLTGLYNQRHFRERLAQEVLRAKRQRHSLSLILMDLDGFKRINDEKGHLEGDRLLKAFSGVLAQSIRKGVDSAYRYGGDEFVVLMPGLSQRQAEAVARRIAACARQLHGGEGVRFSFGAASFPPAVSAAEIVRVADRRMFAMKAKARRRAAR